MEMIVRELRPGDRDAIREMLVACGVFNDEEVGVALELIDEGHRSGPHGDYSLLVAEANGQVRGYVCVGQTPLTRSTWHLYWICSHPLMQGQGIGRALQAHAEAFVQSRGGERLVLETSSTPGYAAARRFYESAGYTVAGHIPDFYRPGDDCILYFKAFL